MVPQIQGCGRGRAAGGADPCSLPPASRKQAHGFSFLNLPSRPLSEELQLEAACVRGSYYKIILRPGQSFIVYDTVV